MADYSSLSPDLRQTIARARRTARRLEKEGRVREARDLDRTASWWAGFATGYKMGEGKAVEQEAVSA